MKDVEEKLVQASKSYCDLTALRAAINAIPWVGGPLDILFSSSGQKYVIKRIESLIGYLKDELSKLHEEKINKGYLQTEEGFDLIVQAFGSAARTRQTEKLKLYARIVKGALTEGKEFESDDPEIFLKIVEELSVKELRVAKHLFILKEVRKETADTNTEKKGEGMSNDAYWLSKENSEFDKDELISILVRLERTGLIKEIVGTYLGYSGGQYQINALFRKFIQFIDDESRPG